MFPDKLSGCLLSAVPPLLLALTTSIMSGQLLALLSLIPACLAFTTGKLPASLITELDSPPFAQDASYFP